jgi:hypothetical protein
MRNSPSDSKAVVDVDKDDEVELEELEEEEEVDEKEEDDEDRDEDEEDDGDKFRADKGGESFIAMSLLGVDMLILEGKKQKVRSVLKENQGVVNVRS